MTKNASGFRTHDPLARGVLFVLAVTMLLAGAISFLTGTSLFFPSVRWSAMWSLNPAARVAFQTLGNEAGYVLLAVAAASLCSGLGLFWRRKWAWWAALILMGLDAVGELIRLLATHAYARYGPGIVLAVCFIALLAMPGVRDPMR